MKKTLYVLVLLALLATLLSACVAVTTPTPRFIRHQIVTLNSGNYLISAVAGKVGIDSDVVCHAIDAQRFEVVVPPIQIGASFWYELSPLDNTNISCLAGWIQEFSIPSQ